MYARIPAPSDLYGESGSNKSDEDTTCAEAKSEESDSFLKIEKTGTTAESCLRIEDRQSKPKNISQHLWEKFKVLQKRTDDATRRSTEKRIKHLQRETLAKVQEEITNPDDIDILREHDVRLGPPVIRNPEKTPSGQKRKNEDKPSDAPSTSTSNAEWLEVRDLLTVNDHLKGVDPGKHAPKTQLEKNVDAAIAGGDLEEAEELSDRLATREFGKKIADAMDARNYLRDKQKEAETDKAKKKRKLNWGFEHKQRWETKGNM
ncbi:protein FAM204A-like [Haliotis rufescens]|uniref:protein FAM204A-like n=1 Tax=Haliotis rufescens TaxID=6454 RepID=UPI00201EB6A1|nr:protein FAM204A-like [Haliotis rufescens]